MQAYPNAKVILNLKIASFLKESPLLEENPFGYFEKVSYIRCFLFFPIQLFFENNPHTAPCPDPGLPSNGKRDGSDFGHDKTVTFQCNDNFSLVGNDAMSCNDGVWSANLPQCKGNTQSKNSELFERKPLTRRKPFSVLGKGFVYTLFLILCYSTFL